MAAFVRPLAGAFALILASAIFAGTADGRSAMSPRHSGLEPPGGPRRIEMAPGAGLGRTPEGGMGYTDAYGNTMYDRQPEEKKPKKRPRPGAYGGYGQKEAPALLPDPTPPGKPVWSFK